MDCDVTGTFMGGTELLKYIFMVHISTSIVVVAVAAGAIAAPTKLDEYKM
jgi:hypothetical protein